MMRDAFLGDMEEEGKYFTVLESAAQIEADYIKNRDAFLAWRVKEKDVLSETQELIAKGGFSSEPR